MSLDLCCSRCVHVLFCRGASWLDFIGHCQEDKASTLSDGDLSCADLSRNRTTRRIRLLFPIRCCCCRACGSVAWCRKIYQYVIEKERKGDYLGKTVQVSSRCCLRLYSPRVSGKAAFLLTLSIGTKKAITSFVCAIRVCHSCVQPRRFVRAFVCAGFVGSPFDCLIFDLVWESVRVTEPVWF